MIGLKAAPVLRFWRSAPPVSVQDTETGAWAQLRPQTFRSGECTRVRAVPQAVQAAVRDAQRHYVQSLLRALRGSVGEG